jgi:hypothetical protein
LYNKKIQTFEMKNHSFKKRCKTLGLAFGMAFFLFVASASALAQTPPKIETKLTMNYEGVGLNLGGIVSDFGGNTITTYGVCWGTGFNPTAVSGYCSETSGSPTLNTAFYYTNPFALPSYVTYHARAYVKVGDDIYYGDNVTFSRPGYLLMLRNNSSGVYHIFGGHPLQLEPTNAENCNIHEFWPTECLWELENNGSYVEVKNTTHSAGTANQPWYLNIPSGWVAEIKITTSQSGNIVRDNWVLRTNTSAGGSLLFGYMHLVLNYEQNPAHWYNSAALDDRANVLCPTIYFGYIEDNPKIDSDTGLDVFDALTSSTYTHSGASYYSYYSINGHNYNGGSITNYTCYAKEGQTPTTDRNSITPYTNFNYTWSLCMDANGTPCNDSEISVNPNTGEVTYGTSYYPYDQTRYLCLTATWQKDGTVVFKDYRPITFKAIAAYNPTSIAANDASVKVYQSVKGERVGSSGIYTLGSTLGSPIYHYVTATIDPDYPGDAAYIDIIPVITTGKTTFKIKGKAVGTAHLIATAYKKDGTVADSDTFTVTVSSSNQYPTGIGNEEMDSNLPEHPGKQHTVYLNDLEDHSWNYYSETSVDSLRSLNPADIQITYYGNGQTDYNMTTDDTDDNPTTYAAKATGVKVGVGTTEDQHTFVYYETLERQNPDDGSGNLPYTMIANPFQVRPKGTVPENQSITPETRTVYLTAWGDYDDSYWYNSSTGSFQYTYTNAIGKRVTRVYTFSGTAYYKKQIKVMAGTTIDFILKRTTGDGSVHGKAGYSEGGNEIIDLSTTGSTGTQTSPIIVPGSPQSFTFSAYRGFYKWRVKKLSDGLGIRIGSITYDNSDYASIPLINADQEIQFVTSDEYGNEVEFEALWAQAYVMRCSAEDLNFNDLSETSALDNDTLRTRVSCERNFVVIVSDNTDADIDVHSQKPVTISTRYPDGTAGASLTSEIRHSFICYNDTRFEYITFNGSDKYIEGQGYNLTIGRGVEGNSSHYLDAIRGCGESSSTTEEVKYTIRVESGWFRRFYMANGNAVGRREYGYKLSARAVLGCDYDRACENGNSHLYMAGNLLPALGENEGMYGGLAMQMNSEANATNLTFDWNIKSGKFYDGILGKAQGGTQAIYMGSSHPSTSGSLMKYIGKRRLVMEGGEIASIAGGINSKESGGTYNSHYANQKIKDMVTIRIKGGTVRGAVYGAAAYAGAAGGRSIIATGGRVQGWIAGGCNGTRVDGGELYGDTYMYLGGNFRVVQTGENPYTTTTPSDPLIGQAFVQGNQDGSGAYGGYVFGAGCGFMPKDIEYTAGGSGTYIGNITVGKVFGSTIVVADNAEVGRDIYGGGNFGFVGNEDFGGTNTNHTAKIYILGGEIHGDVCGGSNSQKGEDVEIYIKGGKLSGRASQNPYIDYIGNSIKGSVYGGSDNWGTINGQAIINMSGGTLEGSVYGGGFGAATHMHYGSSDTDRSVIVNISGGHVKTNVYGGGELGEVDYCTEVNITGGTIGIYGDTDNKNDGNVFGGGMGNTADVVSTNGKVGKNTFVNVSGGDIYGSVYGGGQVASVGTSGTPGTGKATVVISGGTIGDGTATGDDHLQPYGGNVYGAGRGIAGASGSHYPEKTNVNETDVTVSGGFIHGSVFGGGEDGHVLGNTLVKVNGGIIGGDGNGNLCHNKFHGNVYAGGRGIDKYEVSTGVYNFSPTAGKVSGNAEVRITGGTITRNVYGGGNMASVVGNAIITVQSDGSKTVKIGIDPDATYTVGGVTYRNWNGYVFGSAHGEANPQYKNLANVNNATVVIGKTGVANDKVQILGSVFGSGDDGHVLTNATVTVNSGTIGKNGSEDDGNVYGGGRGVDKWTYSSGGSSVERFSPTAGLVRGNTTVTINDGFIKHNVYGGGKLASVGEYITYDPVTYDTYGYEIPKLDNYGTIQPKSGTGLATVTINGGTIGTDGNENGHVFGSGFGYPEGTELQYHELAFTNQTDVTITGEATVKGSVFGSGENGHVRGNTLVKIEGGTVGTTGITGYDGNVYGGGRGKDKNNSGLFSPTAGQTYGNSEVRISDGVVKGSVFGGGRLASVGVAGNENTGWAKVTVSGGTIGTEGNQGAIGGNVYGSSKGLAGAAYHELAFVKNSIVTVSGGNVYGAVFGGGEDGHVRENTKVTISGGVIGFNGGSAYKGNVYGGGRGIDLDENGHISTTAGKVFGRTRVYIDGGHIYNSVYGGGNAAIVDDNIVVNMNGGTVHGNVFGGCHTVPANRDNFSFKTVNMRGGTVDGSVYGCSYYSIDGDPLSEPTTANPLWNAFVNISGGTIGDCVHGAGHSGTVKGSVSLQLGAGAIAGWNDVTNKFSDLRNPLNVYFNNSDGAPTVTAPKIDITSTTTTATVVVMDGTPTTVGVCYNTDGDPTILDSHTEITSGIGEENSFNLTSSLSANTLYYMRAYATNANGTFYSNPICFTNTNGLPAVRTREVTNITTNSAKGHVEVSYKGAANVTACGVCYGTSKHPTTENSTVGAGPGVGIFECNLTGLETNTTYYIRAYATNSYGTSYGKEMMFKTAEGQSFHMVYPEPVLADGIFPVATEPLQILGSVYGGADYYGSQTNEHGWEYKDITGLCNIYIDGTRYNAVPTSGLNIKGGVFGSGTHCESAVLGRNVLIRKLGTRETVGGEGTDKDDVTGVSHSLTSIQRCGNLLFEDVSINLKGLADISSITNPELYGIMHVDSAIYMVGGNATQGGSAIVLGTDNGSANIDSVKMVRSVLFHTGQSYASTIENVGNLTWDWAGINNDDSQLYHIVSGGSSSGVLTKAQENVIIFKNQSKMYLRYHEGATQKYGELQGFFRARSTYKVHGSESFAYARQKFSGTNEVDGGFLCYNSANNYYTLYGLSTDNYTNTMQYPYTNVNSARDDGTFYRMWVDPNFDGQRWYVDGTGGNDDNDGKYPDTPKKTVSAILATTGGGSFNPTKDIIYVVRAIDGTLEASELNNGNTTNRLELYRYPGGHPLSGSTDPGANKGAMLNVGNKNLTMTNVLMDGLHGYSAFDVTYHLIPTGYDQTTGDMVVTSPLVVTTSGSDLTLKGGTELKRGYNGTDGKDWFENALYSGSVAHGGAVYIHPGATLKVEGNVTVTENYQYCSKVNGAFRSNVYLPTFTKAVTITNTLVPDARIGITSPIRNNAASYLNNTFSPVAVATRSGATDGIANATIDASNAWRNQNIFDDLNLFFVNGHRQDDQRSTYYSENNPNTLYFGWTWNAVVRAKPAGYDDTDADNIVITDAKGLAWFSNKVNGLFGAPLSDFDGKTVKLDGDIDLKEFVLVPIGARKPEAHPFKGTFDGQGHVISNLEIHYLGEDDRRFQRTNYGLFGNVNCGHIERTFVLSGHIDPECNANIGGLVGWMDGADASISNSEAAVDLYCSNLVDNDCAIGGLVGNMSDGEVHSSVAIPKIHGSNQSNLIGGLVGRVKAVGAGSVAGDPKVNNSYTYPSFVVGPDHVFNMGGLIGDNYIGESQNCYVHLQNKTNLNDNKFALFAYSNSNDIKYCYASESDAFQFTHGDAGWVDPHVTECYRFTPVMDADKFGYLYADNTVKDASDEPLFEKLNSNITNTLVLNDNLHKYTRWARPTIAEINGDYPVLLMCNYGSVDGNGDFNAMATFSGTQALQYTGVVRNAVPVTNMLTNTVTTGDYVYIYGDVAEAALSGNQPAKVAVHEDATILHPGVLGSDGAQVYVGVTFANNKTNAPHSFGGELLPRDWHMLASPLQDAPLGIAYDGTQYAYNVTPWYQLTPANTADGYIPSNTEPGHQFDFFCFLECTQKGSPQWINFKRNRFSHWHQQSNPEGGIDHDQITNFTNETTLIPGKGYMMTIGEGIRTDHKTYMQSHGKLNNEAVSIQVTNNSTGEWSGSEYNGKGNNLIGNPFHAYLDFTKIKEGGNNSESDIDTYYVYDASVDGYRAYPISGSWGGAYASQYLHPHQGFFVVTKKNGSHNISFNDGMLVSRSTATSSQFRDESPAYPLVNLFAEDEEGRNEILVIEFERPENGGGKKARALRSGNHMMWAHNGEDDYGAFFAEKGTKRVPVRFKTFEDGLFTLRWDTQNGNFAILRLIDNLTGVNYDMTAHDSYTFYASKEDYVSRFIISLEYNDVEEMEDVKPTSFVFFDGSEWVVNGKGRLEVIDVLGHVLISTELTDEQNRVNLNRCAKGVYLMRLVDGEHMRTQKIIIQ